MVSSSDLTYKLMRRDFQPITFLDFSRTHLMYFYMKYNLFLFFLFSVVHKALQSLYLFLFLSMINSGWWIVKPKGSSLQSHQNCVCSTLKSATIIILI